MGKPTGFLEYNRELPADREPKERICDWKEFHTHFDSEKLKTQGARCMDCGVPFCHTGELVRTMALGCPLHNLIPEWNDLLFRGKYELAYERLKLTNNFPEFTGRVCPAPCEGSCTCGLNGEPVTIRNNECHIIDKMYETGAIKARIPKISTGKCVAVVGSGPSGLACADELNQMGHKVTVFERADRPGGLLMYGIPNMKLDKYVVSRKVEYMKKEGVEFVCSKEVGKDIMLKDLKRDFDAVVLCCGASKPRELKVPGSELKGVHYAVEFLSKNTKSLLDSNLTDGKFINAKDKNVVIIGGGDTGTDCVGTSIRHGCKSVTQLEIMAEMPEKRAENNPWPEYPRVKKTDYGQEESIEVFGHDPRLYLTTVTKVNGDENGNVVSIDVVNVEWKKSPDGRMSPVPVEGSQKTLPCELLLVAMGFMGPEQTLVEQNRIETDARSNFKADSSDHKTNVKGVFAAGDCRRGQSLVVWAIREGREAAQAVDGYLAGRNY